MGPLLLNLLQPQLFRASVTEILREYVRKSSISGSKISLINLSKLKLLILLEQETKVNRKKLRRLSQNNKKILIH